MKRRYPMLLMLVFGLTAVWTSIQNYRIAQREISDDLTQALLMTQAERPVDWLSTDTIRQFRSHIMREELREAAVLSFSIGEADDRAVGICSRALDISSCVRARGYLYYSGWQVWRMSDQRLAFFMALMMLACMAWSLEGKQRWNRSLRGKDGATANDVRSLRLTPMQEQLVTLLMSTPERSMSKQDLCQALWPGKPDASETLYTLVRRTKQALEAEGRISIASERGRSYRIEVM